MTPQVTVVGFASAQRHGEWIDSTTLFLKLSDSPRVGYPRVQPRAGVIFLTPFLACFFLLLFFWSPRTSRPLLPRAGYPDPPWVRPGDPPRVSKRSLTPTVLNYHESSKCERLTQFPTIFLGDANPLGPREYRFLAVGVQRGYGARGSPRSRGTLPPSPWPLAPPVPIAHRPSVGPMTSSMYTTIWVRRVGLTPAPACGRPSDPSGPGALRPSTPSRQVPPRHRPFPHSRSHFPPSLPSSPCCR